MHLPRKETSRHMQWYTFLHQPLTLEDLLNMIVRRNLRDRQHDAAERRRLRTSP